jgi:hypothetical protein
MPFVNRSVGHVAGVIMVTLILGNGLAVSTLLSVVTK